MMVLYQVCDGCNKARDLKVSESGRHRTNIGAAQSEGWHIVGPNKHLCPACIKKALAE